MNRLARTFVVALICAATLACTLSVSAGSFLYPGSRKTINCGVVWLPNTDTTKPILYTNGDEVRSFGNGGAGDIFGKLDAALAKPADWNLENPVSPADPMTGMKYPKWDERYWKVVLSDETDLSDFQAIYFPASGTVHLEPRQREILRKFVDGGGVLWIDNSGIAGPLDFQGTFFIQNFVFVSGGPSVSVEMGAYHPLLSFPFWLNSIDVATLGRGGSAGPFHYDMTSGAFTAVIPSSFDVMLPVAGSGVEPTVAANAYGSGRAVATSNFAGRGVFIHSMEQDNLAAMKFAYNMIAWSSDWTSVGKNPRRTGSAIDTIGGNGVVSYWSHDVALPIIGSTSTGVPRYSSSAVVYKNIAYYSAGDTMYALGIIPKEDLDGDGNWNDGDQSTGSASVPDTSQDLIFTWKCPDGSSLISAPVVITMQNPVDPTKTVEAVAVTTSNGSLYILNAWPVDGSGVLQSTTNQYAFYSFRDLTAGVTFDPPSPPVYASGWFYCTSANGTLYAYNPAIKEWAGTHSGSVNDYTWMNPVAAVAPSAVGPIRGGPNFAYVTSDITQAVIGTIYWATAHPTGFATVLNDQVCSLPLFVTHDRARFSVPTLPISPSTIMINHTGGARIAKYPAPCWVEIFWTDDATGKKKYQRIDYGAGDDGLRNPSPSQMIVPVALDRNMTVYANYTLDYSPGALTPAPNRIQLEPPADTVANPDIPTNFITSTPSIGSQNLLIVNSMLDYSGVGTFPANTGPYAGGYVSAIRMDSEYGSPAANTSAWNYLLHSGKPIQLPSQDSIQYNGGDLYQPAVLQALDGTPILEPRPYGAPVTADGKVFVTVTGKRTNGASVSAILCFRENADFVIRITENGGYTADGMSRGTAKRLYNPTTQVPYKVKVWQPDLISNVTTMVDPLQQAVEIFPADGMIDYERGTITFKDFNKVKIKMRAPNNIGYNITSSLPVWVFLDDKEVPVDFGTWVPRMSALDDTGLPNNVKNLLRPRGDSVDLSHWNNLLWYFVVPNDREICSTPMVLGGKVYFLTSDGLLASINAENGLTQAERLSPTDTNNVQPMLQIPNFGSLPVSARINNYLAASNGVILAPGPNGLFAASNLPTLVADGSRVVEIDGAGETKWSMDKITLPVSIPQVATDTAPRTSIPVNRPSRAKYTPKGEILLVNTGANQVCIVDKTGNIGIQAVNGGYIRWMYDKFSDPYQILKTGQSNTISSPVDAEYWTEIEGSEFVYHCMIADAGNHRVIDLVYRVDSATNQILNTGIDPDTGFILPELRWATRSEKRYTIESIQRVFRDTLSDVQDVWIACSAVQTMGAVGTPAVAKGAIMSVPYRERTGPDVWNYVVTNSGVIDANPPVSDGLSGLRYARVYGPPNNRYMFICDKFGVSKLNIDTSGALTLVGQLKEADYQARGTDFTDIPLNATSVQEVSLGNWMIVNSFVGGTFGGEVFEYTPPANPKTAPTSSAFRPLCPTTTKNSYALHQPSSAERAF